MKPVFLVGILASPKWVKPAVRANLALGNASGKGNAALRRMGKTPMEISSHCQGMNRGEFYKWFNGK